MIATERARIARRQRLTGSTLARVKPLYKARCQDCPWTSREYARFSTADAAARDHAGNATHTAFVEDQVRRIAGSMHLRPGRVRDMVNESVADGGSITCHKTLDYGEHPDYGEAMCRGFYDAVGDRTNVIRVMNCLGGFREVPPPGVETTGRTA